MADDEKNRFMDPGQAYEQASALIDYAIEGRWDELKLANMGLERVPEKIAECDRLTSLDLSGNRLTFLPDAMRDLTDLMALNLRSNRFDEIPSWMGAFTEMRSLNLSENRLHDLPDGFNGLYRLVDLDLSVNRFTEVPWYLGILQKLRMLNMANNKLQTLDGFIGGYIALESLDVSYNQIAWLAFRPLSLGRLEALMLGGNQLTDLPLSLATWKHINVLHLHSNQFEHVPHIIGYLTALDYLTLKHNPLDDEYQALVSNFDSREYAEDGKETARRVKAYFQAQPQQDGPEPEQPEPQELEPYTPPKQDPAPHIYEPNEDGRIAPVRRPGEASQPDIAATLYAAVKRKAGALSERVRGRNTPRVETTVTALLSAMGASHAEIDQGLFWEKAISIRADADAYGNPANEGELLPEVLAELLDVAASAEALLTVFPSIQAVIRQAEAERISDDDADAVDDVLSALTDEVAAHPEVVTPDAVETLRENDAAIADARDPKEKRLLLAAKSLNLRNLVAALLKRGAELRDAAWDGVQDGVKKTASLATIGVIVGTVALVPSISAHIPNWQAIAKSGRQFEQLVKDLIKGSPPRTPKTPSQPKPD